MTEEQKPSKEYYSLRELVGEITGVSESGDYDIFESEYKSVQRIVAVMRKLTDTEQKKVTREDKDAFVVITKHLYEMIYMDTSGEGQKLFKRLKQGKELTHTEYSRLIAFFVEGLSANPNHPNFLYFSQQIKRAESDDRVLVIQNEVEKRIIEDFKLMDELDSFEVREQRANDYLAFLTQFEQVTVWRNEVKHEIHKEKTVKKIYSIAAEKGYSPEEVEAGTNPDMLGVIIKEMLNRDIQAWINHKKETEA